jgi:rubrerythrin
VVDIAISKTLDNLVSIFARDAETLIRYRCFSTIARNEGFNEVAEIFDRLAETQLVIAEGHLDFLRTIGDPLNGLPLGTTRDNLAAALASEAYESGDLCPAIAGVAETEGFAAVASWFRSVGGLKELNTGRLGTLLRNGKLSNSAEVQLQ